MVLNVPEAQLRRILPIDDCICDVLLLEYSTRQSLTKLAGSIKARANNLKGLDSRDQDAFWLLIYHVWSVAELKGNGHELLGDLKQQKFSFVRF